MREMKDSEVEWIGEIPRDWRIAKFKFFFCRMIQKSIHKSDPEHLDGKYWAEQGWLDGGKPWK